MEVNAAPVMTATMLAQLAFAALAPADPSRDGGDSSQEARWLSSHRAGREASLENLPAAFDAWREHPADEDRRLVALADTLGLSGAEVIAVALACAVEIDAMAARALAWLQHPIGCARPVTGLVATLAERFGEEAPLAAIAAGAARTSGLLQIDADSRPLPESARSVPQSIVLALGTPPAIAWPGLRLGLPEAPPLPPSLRQAAASRARALSKRAARALVVRSGHPSEAKTLAAEVCARLDGRPLFIEGDPPAGLGPWLFLAAAIPVFCAELAPGDRRRIKNIPGWHGPLLVAAGPDGSFEYEGETLPAWRVPVPTAGERARLWQMATGDAELGARLGSTHRHAWARIAELARAGRYHAELHGVERAGAAEIAAAARGGAGGDLGMLAELLPEPIADDALVLPAATRSELESLTARCAGRDALTEGLGPASRARYRPGVRALLVGPSGTGKTLAAGWLATRLGLPIYRVDLASVTSKYIGETEKNLAQLFARAEHAEVVLLFDEADSLFGKRTDVKDANDRFANAQTNYLLSRIESFEGIAILTSNSRTRFDSAFTRRLDAIVEIPAPGPEERRALWQAHLGEGHDLDQGVLNRLAATVDLAGGHVRNAVLTAAASARAAQRTLNYADLLRGIASEYRKLGRQMPAGLTVGARTGT
jgi:hypothetical protein